MQHTGTKSAKRKKLNVPTSLREKVSAVGGSTGFALEDDSAISTTGASSRSSRHRHHIAHSNASKSDSCTRAAGIFGQRLGTTKNNSSSIPQTRVFPTSSASSRCYSSPSSQGTTSRHSRFSRISYCRPNRYSTIPTTAATAAVHVVCAISENLARETCVSSLDAGSPTTIQIAKQGNGNTYAETITYLEILKPDEILLNEGRRNSQLARKVMELYNIQSNDVEVPMGESRRQRRRVIADDEDDFTEDVMQREDDRYGLLESSTVVKFISRTCFDQTKGAQLLQKIAREETYDATVVEEYILLSSAHALLHYTQQCLGASFSKNSVYLSVNCCGNNRMSIDRSTLFQLELLLNSKTGKAGDSLIGTIDCTKTTVGSRLLRTNIMSPPMRAVTVNARLDLVDLFMGNEEFFYSVLEHLTRLPDIDRMLSVIALIPRSKVQLDGEKELVNERTASRGIASLVCIKTTLQALPALAGVLEHHLHAIEGSTNEDNATVVTDRSSLLVGLGGTGDQSFPNLNRHHLLRAIIFAMRQPALTTVLASVSGIFTESTTAMKNANAMRHQECFALKCDESSMMSLWRRAFLANVDDIYKKADEYAEVHGILAAVRYSASRGYYLAIPIDYADSLPDIFLQPSKTGRFINCTTEEITSLNTRAQDNVHDLLLMTHDRIQEVMNIARENYDAVATLCDSVALLDMCHSFVDHVTVNSSMPWCRPIVNEVYSQSSNHGKNTQSDGMSTTSGGTETQMMIRNGRYPIKTSELATLVGNDGHSELVPNDTYASSDKLFTVITGINGSGKTTYLKQIATITIMAHCGSYVPAEQATIPMRDRLCCRLGNSDDQEHNISTFMLEMKETAFICNNSSEQSLVLIDELGRATSNEDGIAIAWAISEYLLKKRAMTFFVTHYPQLSCLANIYPSVQNVHMEASVSRGSVNANGEISYTHKVRAGACAVSTEYGVELAAACGWPMDVVETARRIEDDIVALLPYESVCHQQTMDQVSTVRTKAYEYFGAMIQDLQNLVTDKRCQSFSSIRSDLIQMKTERVENLESDIISAMDLLLFRESRNENINKEGTTKALVGGVHQSLASPNSPNADRGADSETSLGTSDMSSSSSLDATSLSSTSSTTSEHE